MEDSLNELRKMLQYYVEQGLAVIPAGESIGCTLRLMADKTHQGEGY